jgi:hypothetical protein
VVEWNGLENRRRETYPGFESLPLRHNIFLPFCVEIMSKISSGSMHVLGPEPAIPILTDINELPSGSGFEVLRYPEEPEVTSLQVFKSVLLPMEQYAAQNNLTMSVAVKFYQEQPHGRNDGGEACFWLHPSDLEWGNLKPGINVCLSGVCKIGQEFCFIPTMDFEYPHKDQRLSGLATSKLQNLGLTGYMVNSGFSQHFIGDTFFEYGRNYWKILGLLMKNFTYDDEEFPEEVAKSRSFGERILQSGFPSECMLVAQEGFSAYPSLPTGKIRPGLLFDPRWVFHKLMPLNVEFDLLPINALRVTQGKGYGFPPMFECEIRESDASL